MSVSILDLAPVRERLRDNVPALLQVGGAAAYAQAMASLVTPPAAFVFAGKDRAGESPYMSGFCEQQVASGFNVVLAVRNLADVTGEAATDDLLGIRNAVMAALLGWTPPGAELSIEYESGDLVQFQNAVLWWRESYRAAYLIRSE